MNGEKKLMITICRYGNRQAEEMPTYWLWANFRLTGNNVKTENIMLN